LDTRKLDKPVIEAQSLKLIRAAFSKGFNIVTCIQISAMSEIQNQDASANAPDQRIRDDVRRRFEDESKLDETKIEVEVKNGEVILKGKADTEEEKALAEKIATSVPDVCKVVNHLHVDVGIVHALTMLAAQIAEVEEGKKKEP
jgi:hypothetical protein